MFGELKVFLTVAESRSFTRAARQLNFSQPAISQQIKKLESYFNTPLLLRSSNSRQVELTGDGELVCRYGREILSLLDRLGEDLDRSREARCPPLRVGASMTIGTQLLPQLLQRLRQSCPELGVKIFIGNTRQICDRLDAGEIDIGLIEGKSMYHDFHRTDFYTDPLVLVAAPALAGAFREFSPSALSRCTWITREPGSGTAQYLHAFWESNHITAGERIECNSNEANCRLVVEGLGITFISQLAVSRELASGALVRLPMKRAYSRKFSYITRRSTSLSPASARFREILDRAEELRPLDQAVGAVSTGEEAAP